MQSASPDLHPVSNLNPVLCPKLSKIDKINHGFFTKKGGISKGIYKGLNTGLGSNDKRSDVLANRALIASYFTSPPQNLLSPYQIHSSKVETISKPFNDNPPQCDGLVTDNDTITLGILTADCGPVLFCDPIAGVIGACHSGWLGAASGILENTVQSMVKLGAKKTNIKASLGPTISQKNYEVGPEFIERLLQMETENKQWFIPSENQGHAMFDLPGYIVNRLQKNGVDASWTGQCTYADSGSFFSYRRSVHKNETDYGRQMSAIKLQN